MLTKQGTYKGYNYVTTYSWKPNQLWDENHLLSSVIEFPKNNEVANVVGNATTTYFQLVGVDNELSSWEEVINTPSSHYYEKNYYYEHQEKKVQDIIDMFINISTRKELPVTSARFEETLGEFAEHSDKMNKASFKVFSGKGPKAYKTIVYFNTTKTFNEELINSLLAKMGINYKVAKCKYERYSSSKRYSHELVIDGYVFASNERIEELKRSRFERRVKVDSKEYFRRKEVDRRRFVSQARSLKWSFRYWLESQGKNADDYEVVITFRKKAK